MADEINSYIYIRAANGDVFFFDAVFDVGVSLTGTPTKYAVQSGVSSTDHYVQEQDSISINGSVSEVKFFRNSEESISLEDFERGITQLKRSGQFFTVVCSKYQNPYTNCLFNSLEIKRDTTTGKHCIDVSMQITSITIAKTGNVVSTPRAAREFVDTVEAAKSGSGTSNAVPPQSKLQSLAIFFANGALGKPTEVE